MVSIRPTVSSPPRFGWAAGAEDLKVIREKAKSEWKLNSVEDKLCFTRTVSGFGMINGIKGFFSNLLDSLKLRWQMFRKGYGMFAGCVPEAHDVFRLYRFASPEAAATAQEVLEQTSTKLRNLKNNLLSGAAKYRDTLRVAQDAHQSLDTKGLAIPGGWMNPFPTLAPFKAPGTKSTNGKQPWMQEHYISTTQVAKVDDNTLLVRVRLGPHA